MESRLSAEIRITEDDFRFLAKGRSLAIKSYLAGEGKISSDRLFLIQPASLTPEKVEKVKESRVELAFR